MLQPGGLYNIITFQFLFGNQIEYLLALWSYVAENMINHRLLLLWFENADSCIFRGYSRYCARVMTSLEETEVFITTIAREREPR